MSEHEAVSRWAHLTWIRATDDPDPESECIEVAAGEGELVHIRQTDDPENVVTTTQSKWHAFVLGVRNDEFDHFVDDLEARGGAGG
ncbi:DUF397 domain-containing protein [Streptomyces iconiensis]|uniref:DUF397 domain-containing protein n=1 Tax=Streptomyces iconiensis TaxID=1384038 RepID=A0ABT7ABC9_9ACTN|nr:DUF397 domain-containing protein [Streptomyces iconiensis]MDJ1138357.1 DUF397 domain-containing protein [Streptomyces iconiensis]